MARGRPRRRREDAAARPGGGATTGYGGELDPMDDCIKRNTLEMQMLTKCRDLLLPKLISGDIRLRDAESMVGAVA